MAVSELLVKKPFVRQAAPEPAHEQKKSSNEQCDLQ